jgi:hypothetical protein
MTTIITRDDLHKLYTKNRKVFTEQNIQAYVQCIVRRVLLFNEKGHTTYSHFFNKGSGLEDRPEVVQEIARKIQEIFVDSDVIFYAKGSTDNGTGCQIVINWEKNIE